jgi:hypothetical protein
LKNIFMRIKNPNVKYFFIMTAKGLEPKTPPTNGRKRRQDAAVRGRRRSGDLKQEAEGRRTSPFSRSKRIKI